jgi:Na+-driven multidrug efflux pump
MILLLVVVGVTAGLSGPVCCVGAASTRVGHELGSGRPKQAQLAAATVIGLEVALMILVVVVGIAARDVWGYLFTSDPEVPLS